MQRKFEFLGKKKRSKLGRPIGPNPRIRHETRNDFSASLPCHVTLPVRRDIPSLRSGPIVREVQGSFRKACERGTFRLVHYSIQEDRVHLLVEADGAKALGRGMKSIAARFARAVNRALNRSGPALRDRYHFRALETPTEVRNALRYVLLNANEIPGGLRV